MVDFQTKCVGMSDCIRVDACERTQFSDIEKSLPMWSVLLKWFSVNRASLRSTRANNYHPYFLSICIMIMMEVGL